MTDKIELWLACLAVLDCPYSVEDKVKILTEAIKQNSTDSQLEAINFTWQNTGLDPFDKAMNSFFMKLEVNNYKMD